VILEDHSAKTFNRPEWANLLRDLKERKGQVNLVLFTEWDRFNRNAGDAYQMINTLRKLEVEPQAIEHEAVRLIYLLVKGWHKKEIGETKVDFDLSCFVPRTGIEPEHCCQYQIQRKSAKKKRLSGQTASVLDIG